MSVVHGKAGTATFSGSVVSMLAWTMNVTGDVAESTVMGNTFKSYVAGHIDVSASIDTNAMTEATIARLGANAALALYTDANSYFTISTAVCTELTETVNKDDVGKLSLSFIGDDADGMVFT